MNARQWLLAILAAAAMSVPVMAQGLGGSDPMGDTMTAEQLSTLLKQAMDRRFELERKQVAAEIDGELLFDPGKIDAAIKGLSAGAKNSWSDNTDRILKAFALVDGRFGKAHAIYAKGDFDEAAKALEPLVSSRDTSYMAAAKRYAYAEALAGAGKYEDAVDVFTELVKDMPDRFTFASMALLRAAEVYDKMHRFYYAMTLYNAWVDNFGLLDPKTADELAKKAERIAAEYKDPLNTLAVKMGDVKGRLAAIDSGRQTQTKQKEIVDMLDDLIATAEEQSSSSSSGKGKGEGEGKKPGEGEGEGQGQGKSGQGQGKSGGPPTGIGIPSSPAMKSALVGGTSPRPTGLSELRPSDGTDDWGTLPPRERDKQMETFKESMPERYQSMIRDYYKKLAAEERR